MSGIEDTTGRDPLIHIAGMWDGDAAVTRYIEEMEAAGQQQLLHSDRLPTNAHGDFEALGFTFGDPDPNDPLFRPATLPAGWTREGSDHAMHSYLLDERGIRRVDVFYKAAFYDRRADMYVMNVGRSLVTQAIYGDGEPGGPWDKLTADELADARAEAERYAQDAAEYPDIYAHRLPRVQTLLTQLDAVGGAA